MAAFRALGIAPWLAEQARQVGLTRPTPVQAACIPAVLQGETAAGTPRPRNGPFAAPLSRAALYITLFSVPVYNTYHVQCIKRAVPQRAFLTPSPFYPHLHRTHPTYTCGHPFSTCSLHTDLSTACFPPDMVAQALQLARKPHVVVATPGRLADHLRSSSTFSLRKLRFLVLDEADRLLEQGCADFTADLELILESVPARRQTLLFSATLTATLSQLRGLAANQPFFWEAESEVRTVEELDQRYLLVPEAVKDAYLVHLIQTFQDEHEDWAIIIFTKTCKDCQVLNMMLRKYKFPSVALHSMMKQRQRFAALAKFKSSIFKILIATDVAARGLDIPTVQVVINHNTPGLPKIYIHRVGRTARAGRKGIAITLVTQYDIHLVHAIEEEIKLKLKEFSVEEQHVLDILTQVNVTRRECEIVSGTW
ncbi:DDX49 helicase, partial [Tachuris rubrigastra]|nr:DDX49 helicase [Tachuris rubrigastra]